MARTIDYWYQQMQAQKNATTALNSLTSTSKTAVYNLFMYVVAVAIAALDNLFDLHRSGVDADLATLKPHKLEWYRQLALNFQYGQTLTPDTDTYANVGLSDTQIAAQKIIAQAAVNEVSVNNTTGLRMKVVTSANGTYTPLSTPQYSAFAAYVADQKDAGVDITIDSLPPDNLKLSVDVYYDPLVLLPTGARIDGTASTPIPDAINAYLQNLKFNGEYANTRCSDAMQAVDGAVLINITGAQAKYGLFPFTPINEKYIPDAGYVVIAPGDLTINYLQYV